MRKTNEKYNTTSFVIMFFYYAVILYSLYYTNIQLPILKNLV